MGQSPPVLVPPVALRRRVAELGAALGAAHPESVVLVAVLNGSVIFLSDLVRAMAGTSAEVVVDFVAASRYAPGDGRVRLVKDLDVDVTGRAVVVVQDVVDTGLTLTWLLGELARRSPRSLEVCALVDRRARRLVPVALRWVGFEVGAGFVVGYGLDHDGRYRNLDLLAEADEEMLREDPDALVAALYGSS